MWFLIGNLYTPQRLFWHFSTSYLRYCHLWPTKEKSRISPNLIHTYININNPHETNVHYDDITYKKFPLLLSNAKAQMTESVAKFNKLSKKIKMQDCISSKCNWNMGFISHISQHKPNSECQQQNHSNSIKFHSSIDTNSWCRASYFDNILKNKCTAWTSQIAKRILQHHIKTHCNYR